MVFYPPIRTFCASLPEGSPLRFLGKQGRVIKRRGVWLAPVPPRALLSRKTKRRACGQENIVPLTRKSFTHALTFSVFVSTTHRLQGYWHQVRSHGYMNSAVSIWFSQIKQFKDTNCAETAIDFTPMNELYVLWRNLGTGADLTQGHIDIHILRRLLLSSADGNGKILLQPFTEHFFQTDGEDEVLEMDSRDRMQRVKTGLHVLRKHKHRHKHRHKPRVNRDDASTRARKRNARLCLCLCRPGSHVAYACACACCAVRVNQPKTGADRSHPRPQALFPAALPRSGEKRLGLTNLCRFYLITASRQPLF